MKGCPTENLS